MIHSPKTNCYLHGTELSSCARILSEGLTPGRNGKCYLLEWNERNPAEPLAGALAFAVRNRYDDLPKGWPDSYRLYGRYNRKVGSMVAQFFLRMVSNSYIASRGRRQSPPAVLVVKSDLTMEYRTATQPKYLIESEVTCTKTIPPESVIAVLTVGSNSGATDLRAIAAALKSGNKDEILSIWKSLSSIQK